MTPQQQHEQMRQTIWKDAFCFTASANDCKSSNVAIRYADNVLAAFDQRFTAPQAPADLSKHGLTQYPTKSIF